MTPNPTTKGMSEAEVLALVDQLAMAVLYPLRSSAERARSTIESKFAELTDSREEIAELHVHLQDALECEKIAAEQRDEFRAAYAYLMKVAPWAESNDMTASDEMICGIDGILQRANAAESDRTALLEVVRRLLPYVKAAGKYDTDAGSLATNLARDAEAILSRITESGAKE